MALTTAAQPESCAWRSCPLRGESAARATCRASCRMPQEDERLLMPVLPEAHPDHGPLGDIEGGKEAGRAVTVVVVRRSGEPGCNGSSGCERLRACTWLFSSTYSTTAWSGGLMCKPTTSRTLSTNCGSSLILNVLSRWGWRPKARQIQLVAVWERPAISAMERVLQCVAFLGFESSVRVTTLATLSSVIDRGATGRGSSCSPSSRWLTNLCRHLPTVGLATPRRVATSIFVSPTGQCSTIRARKASACAVLRVRDNDSGSRRTASLI